ncbi:NAD(+) diphosphatase [Clostridium sp. DL1XJH146]
MELENYMSNNKINSYSFLIFNKDELLIKKDETLLILPDENTFKTDILSELDGFFICEYNNIKYYVIDLQQDLVLPENYIFKRYYDCRDFCKQKIFSIAGQAYQLLNWSRKHQYCGVCGTQFKSMNSDRSKSCPKCNNLLFPQTSPAIIVAIIKDNKLLLAHNNNFPEGLYSIIAGFVELGESLEETVRREVMEEVGLKVKNIRYFSSQPWPFPNSLMLGFVADYDSGEIKTDGVEIAHADWFTADNLPIIPHKQSIARTLIDWYISNYTQN